MRVALPLVLGVVFMLCKAEATELYCPVSRKLDAERTYSVADIERGQFSVRITGAGPDVVVQRCSYALSAGRVTCDQYVPDRVERDPYVGITKYYFFRNQFDVQVFPDSSFVENNGRGGIAFGRCGRAS